MSGFGCCAAKPYIAHPTDTPLVRKTMQGIARLYGTPKKQALALRLEDLDKISEYLVERGGLADIRNRVLILS